MDFSILGWIGMGITVVAFGIVNIKKFERSFFPLNAFAAIFLMIYEISIFAWPVLALHTFVMGTSLIKSWKVLKK